MYQDVPITRIRIGHTHLSYSYLINNEPQPICDKFKKNTNCKTFVGGMQKIYYNTYESDNATSATQGRQDIKNYTILIINQYYK